MNIFSTEQVSKFHPDKVADQISDAIVTECLRKDPNSRVAIECMIKDDCVFLAGEITSTAEICYKDIVRRVLDKLRYFDDFKLYEKISRQSPEISNAVYSGGELKAGDQGIMFGFATRESESMLPWPFELANKIINLIENEVYNTFSPLRGDAKTQVTVDLDSADKIPELILISACHKGGVSLNFLKLYFEKLLNDAGIKYKHLIINPSGPWTIGGPRADCGLTGRKIVCDQYGGFIPVGGGAFSGKDPTKVDRSASYMARHLALKVLDKFPDIKWCKIQLAYGIGISEPISINVDVPGSMDLITEVENYLSSFDLSPNGIIKTLNLLAVDYEQLAEGCHYRYDWTKAITR